MPYIQRKQSGFTLVEIAIVLVIIGLLLGGVLKGQELINNAKIKSVISDMKSVPTAYYAYMDRYRAVPGDDLTASTRFTGGDNGQGNGTISGLYNAQNGTNNNFAESNLFWQHTRMAGFMSGTATDTVALPPLNSAGGMLGIQSSSNGVATDSTYGITGPVVCIGGVPWKIAQSVDIQLDNGVSDTGNLRAGATGAVNQGTATATAAVYGPAVPVNAAIEAGIHTICMQI